MLAAPFPRKFCAKVPSPLRFSDGIEVIPRGDMVDRVTHRQRHRRGSWPGA